MNVLVCVTGSVATIKVGSLVESLLAEKEVVKAVKVCPTQSALRFIRKERIDLESKCPVITDEQEWREWNQRGDPVIHIDLCKWADVLVIAPLSANTLGKLASGMADNLVTCVVCAWHWSDKPVILAPAMNGRMWENPMVQRNLRCLRQAYPTVRVVQPIRKKLMCGDVSIGAMAEVSEIVRSTVESKSEDPSKQRSCQVLKIALIGAVLATALALVFAN